MLPWGKCTAWLDSEASFLASFPLCSVGDVSLSIYSPRFYREWTEHPGDSHWGHTNLWESAWAILECCVQLLKPQGNRWVGSQEFCRTGSKRGYGCNGIAETWLAIAFLGGSEAEYALHVRELPPANAHRSSSIRNRHRLIPLSYTRKFLDCHCGVRMLRFCRW